MLVLTTLLQFIFFAVIHGEENEDFNKRSEQDTELSGINHVFSQEESQVQRNGRCFNDATKLEVYFNKVPRHVLYTVCFDEKLSKTLYSHGEVDGKAISEGLMEPGNKRPSFKDMGFFPFDVNEAYNKQVTTLGNLLGSEDFYITNYKPKSDYIFSRGHLYPNGDPIHTYEKKATFYYINAVPQWQILNAGNWVNLEKAVRNLASKMEQTFQVWTGTYRVLELADINANSVSLWLEQNDADEENININRFPVPKFMWKVLYNKEENAAVALIQINNPWANVSKEDILCEDICDKLSWIKFKTTDVKRGYTYCCDVDSLRKKIEYVPSLEYSRILGYVKDEP